MTKKKKKKNVSAYLFQAGKWAWLIKKQVLPWEKLMFGFLVK